MGRYDTGNLPVSVPLRGALFHNKTYRNRFEALPVSFPSPYGELYSITMEMDQEVEVIDVSVPLRGALFHNANMEYSNVLENVFPSPYGEHYSITDDRGTGNGA